MQFIKKLECVGHIQKRVGSRLRKLKEKNKGIGGKGKLTDKVINTLQNYYGMAIRNNTGDIITMKKSIAAVIHHCTEKDNVSKEVRHQYCPLSGDSWCKFQKNKFNGTVIKPDRKNMSVEVFDKVRPIFIELSENSLLERCIHGRTQNVNEAFNAYVWKRCPKDIFVSKTILDIATASAVVAYNDGALGIVNIMKNLNLHIGFYNFTLSKHTDLKKIKGMNYKSTPVVQKHRKKLHAKKKG